MFCKYCGGEINSKNKFCIYCGKPIIPAESIAEENISKEQEKSNKGFPWFKFIIIIFVIFTLFYTIFLIADNDSIATKNEYIDDIGILYEMDPFLQPVGFFAEPSPFYSDSISGEEWLSYFKYTEPAFLNFSESSNPRFPNQLDAYSAVVKIICQDDNSLSFSSGINMNNIGFVITNAHIFEGMRDFECLVGFPDPETGLIREAYWATPIIDDKSQMDYDLAFLCIDDIVIDKEYNVYGFYEKVLNSTFPYYEETDECLNTAPSLGDKVFILGYPFLSGGALTITDGLISSLYSYNGYLITSAKIGSGNSGGLAIDNKGCFVGVPTAVYSDEQDENYGEIIDAAFVYEFYNTMIDYYFDEYLSDIDDTIFNSK